MNFTRQELINMVYSLGEADRNILLAQRIYNQKYPDARMPQSAAFEKLRERFEATGSVTYKKKDVLGRKIDENLELEVLLMLQENPELSCREIEAETDISRTSVNRITLKHKFHPYHIELHQELFGHDFQSRVNFCVTMDNLINNDWNFMHTILFSDEATFKSNGSVNRHNMHYYATANPHWMHTIDHQNRWSLNVWGGILGEQVIGPFFFDGVLNGLRYCEFLQNDLPLLMENVDLNTRRIMWLQQDGAPVHYHGVVRQFLNETFPNRWIGRGGAIGWPGRSPDLTPIDFFLWGFVKDKVYKLRPTTAEDMKQRIRDTFRLINADMLSRVRLSFRRRLQVCIEENGHIYEHLL